MDMLKYVSKFSVYLMVVVIGILPSLVFAHPLDVAYLDIGLTASSTYTLTVAIHPYQAYELVRDKKHEQFNLAFLREQGDIVSAYVQSHVMVDDCEWGAGSARVPPTDIEAVADGVTVEGNLNCKKGTSLMHVEATLFIDGFPNQTNIIRFDLPDGFTDRFTLNKKITSADIDLNELDVAHLRSQVQSIPNTDGRSGGALAILAEKILVTNTANIWQMIFLFGSVFIIGALHALGPGHGKSLMAAAMIGQKPTIKKAFILGGIMAGTHVADVICMSLIAGFVTATIPVSRFFAFLQYLSALGLCFLGIIALIRAIYAYKRILRKPILAELDDAHARIHASMDFKRSLWAGFVGSLAPCPTAWAIFMATLAIGRWKMGFLVLIVFSVGLTSTIISLGCLMVISSNFMKKRTPLRFTYILPIISSVLVLIVGIVLLWRIF